MARERFEGFIRQTIARGRTSLEKLRGIQQSQQNTQEHPQAQGTIFQGGEEQNPDVFPVLPPHADAESIVGYFQTLPTDLTERLEAVERQTTADTLSQHIIATCGPFVVAELHA